MTNQEIISHYPCAYHMAESGTWNSIRRHGLLSTIALLDLFEITEDKRRQIAEERRPESVVIRHPMHGTAVIRDQKPMSESALWKCLQHGMTPTQWYRMLNGRAFFWVSEARLNRLLSARAYRSKQHCILTLDTAGLIRRYEDRITLCHINSGSTIYRPQPRGANTFRRICDYPFDDWKRRRGVQDAVVELVVEYSVPDVADFVLRVEERQGANLIKRVFTRHEP